MATIETIRTGQPADEQRSTSSSLRMVPVSAIRVREHFNPRAQRDASTWDRTAASVREHGVLAPILVTPTAPGAETFWLVAGEGRFRAAVEAGHEEVPVSIRDVDERTKGLELALLENMARENLDPVAVARGMARLRAAGWSPRQIAEELSVTQKLVTERLRILQVPEELHARIATGEIPLSAVRPLAQIAQVHSDLPAVLVARVLDGEPPQPWADRLDWPAVVDDPIAALTVDYHGLGCDLPPGVYDAAKAYAPTDLLLTDEARAELRELAELRGADPDHVRVQITREGLDQAKALRAAFPSAHGYAHVIVGGDVMAQVIADQTHGTLTHMRERAAAARRDERNADAYSEDGSSSEPTQEEVAEQRARDRRERLEHQRAARSHNAELGAAVVRSLARVRLDLPLLRILLAVQPLDDLSGLAARGARYCLPGWPVEETTASGQRVRYLDPVDAGKRAEEYLQGASTIGETCGRLLSLIALARYADDDAVALTRRVTCRLPSAGVVPWSDDVLDSLDAICAERLPDHLTRPVRDRVRAEREAREEDERVRRVARERVERLTGRLEELNAAEREALIGDAKSAFGDYSPQVWELRRKLRTLDETASGGDAVPATSADDQETGSETSSEEEAQAQGVAGEGAAAA